MLYGSLGASPVMIDFLAGVGTVLLASWAWRQDPAIQSSLTWKVDRHTAWLPLAALLGMGAFMALYLSGLGRLGFETESSLAGYDLQGWTRLLAYLTVALLPGITEEIAFRGYIYNRLLQTVSQREALIVQAAMFSVLHLNPTAYVSHFVFGYVLGLLRARTSSLLPGMLVHVAWNGLVVTLDWVELG